MIAGKTTTLMISFVSRVFPTKTRLVLFIVIVYFQHSIVNFLINFKFLNSNICIEGMM